MKIVDKEEVKEDVKAFFINRDVSIIENNEDHKLTICVRKYEKLKLKPRENILEVWRAPIKLKKEKSIIREASLSTKDD